MDGESILQFSHMPAIRGETRRLSRSHSSRSLWTLPVRRLSWRSWASACSRRLDHSPVYRRYVLVIYHLPLGGCARYMYSGHLSAILC